MNINTQLLFPTPFWTVDLDINNSELTRECYRVRRNEKGVFDKSNRGGYHSDNLSFNIGFDSLLHTICNTSKKILTDYYSNTREVSINPYWVNINRIDNYNVRHIHPGCILSGVYYVKCQNVPEQGSLVLHMDEKEQFILNSNHLNIKTKEIITPKEGMLVLFPSYVPHTVLPNTLNCDRISISFNLVFN